MAGAVVILRTLSTWRPIPNIPINVPVNPDVNTYALAFLLAVFSGLFFGLVPVRQILRSDPWQIIRSGSTNAGSTRRFTLRDVLLGLQIAICSVLVTASLVAVRGLARSLQNNYGIQPKNVMLVKTDLKMAGYACRPARTDAEAHARCCRSDPGRHRRGICRSASAQYRRRRFRRIH